MSILQPQLLFGKLEAPPASTASLLSLAPQQLTEVIANVIEKGSGPGLTDWLQVGITVVANLVLGYVAWKSARSSEESAEAARKSADIASTEQRPRFIVKLMQFKVVGKRKDGTLECSVFFRLNNHGATTAEITQVRHAHAISRTFPEEPIYDYVPEYRRGLAEALGIFGVVTDTSENHSLEYGFQVSPEEAKGIESGSLKLWISGCLCYRDYLDEDWVKTYVGILPFLQRQLIIDREVRLVRPPIKVAKHEATRRGVVDQQGSLISTRTKR
ncbi:hypothetical protein [Caballeronia sp. LZ035]|uniref:hypothetical protein n=1 Tax=Caballeronia sp. LZ035 TaxID=3038568 RepID=UPI00285CC05A|nr:hypothetical protein [Caballeronia sp. LZ035]MDR5762272.1 hypothetical protein [Caballeronia sp. LZ035]